METKFEVIIIGSGAAGLTAGLYTARGKLSTVLIERETIGGEMMNRDLIENYPGYPDGILGPELGSNMMTQAMNYGAEFTVGEVEGITLDGGYRIVRTSDNEYRGKAVIIATGAHPRKLGVPGEEELTGSGVFYCATCDGPGFANKPVVVAGGGDSGLTEALFLARFCSSVEVLEILPKLTANKTLQERALANPKIKIRCGCKIEAIKGTGHMTGLEYSDVQTGQKNAIEAEGLLVHAGVEPNTGFLKGTLDLNQKRQVPVNESLQTTVPGIYGAGDVRAFSPMQIATAVGDGACAAMGVVKYLETGWKQ